MRARLQHLAVRSELKVIAPVPLVDYLHPTQKLRPRSAVPFRRLDEHIEVCQPRWFYPPFGTPLNIFCLFLRVLPIATSLRAHFAFDIIDSHFGYPEGVAAALLSFVLGVPFTVTLRGNEIKFAKYRFRRALLAWALKRAACVISVSEELRHLAISLGVDPARTRTIPNGIDPSVFRPLDRKASREKYGIPDGSLAVVCVGELVERKGHHLVITSLRQIVDSGLNAHVWIAGTAGRDGPGYEGVIRRRASELQLDDRVHFLGFVPRMELASLMSAADVFCLPSTMEGWPNVVHEASACGAPVVATNVGGVPEMLPSERHGFVVPVGDQRALDRALIDALRKNWDRDAISSWGRARSWKAVAGEVLEQIETILDRDLEPGGRLTKCQQY